MIISQFLACFATLSIAISFPQFFYSTIPVCGQSVNFFFLNYWILWILSSQNWINIHYLKRFFQSFIERRELFRIYPIEISRNFIFLVFLHSKWIDL